MHAFLPVESTTASAQRAELFGTLLTDPTDNIVWQEPTFIRHFEQDLAEIAKLDLSKANWSSSGPSLTVRAFGEAVSRSHEVANCGAQQRNFALSPGWCRDVERLVTT